MYELAGGYIHKYFNYADPNHTLKFAMEHIYLLVGSTTFRCFKILPPARSYIIIPPGGIIMYGLVGGTILK
jgi:hypothetical protein